MEMDAQNTESETEKIGEERKDQWPIINSTFRRIFNTRSQAIVDVCLEMFNCLQVEQTIAIHKRKF